MHQRYALGGIHSSLLCGSCVAKVGLSSTFATQLKYSLSDKSVIDLYEKKIYLLAFI